MYVLLVRAQKVSTDGSIFHVNALDIEGWILIAWCGGVARSLVSASIPRVRAKGESIIKGVIIITDGCE
jgi:hypothetical protein